MFTSVQLLNVNISFRLSGWIACCLGMVDGTVADVSLGISLVPRLSGGGVREKREPDIHCLRMR